MCVCVWTCVIGVCEWNMNVRCVYVCLYLYWRVRT